MKTNNEALKKLLWDVLVATILASIVATASSFNVVKDQDPANLKEYFDFMSKFGFVFFGFVMTSVSITVVLIDKPDAEALRESMVVHDELWGTSKRSLTFLSILSITALSPMLFSLTEAACIWLFYIVLGLAFLCLISIGRVVVNTFKLIAALRSYWTREK